MGLLDSVIGSVVGSKSGSSPTSPMVKAILLLLAAKVASDHLGGSHAAEAKPGAGHDPAQSGKITEGVLAGLPNLDTLLGYFKRSSYGDRIESWVGPGENKPIRPQELQEALGADTVDRLQKATGLPRDQLLSQLSDALPQVVDKLTPHGRPPTPEEARHW